MAKFQRYLGGEVDPLRGGLDLEDKERAFQDTMKVSGLYTRYFYRDRKH